MHTRHDTYERRTARARAAQWWACLLLACLTWLCAPVPSAAQQDTTRVAPAPDTTVADTTVADTTRADTTAADTTAPPGGETRSRERSEPSAAPQASSGPFEPMGFPGRRRGEVVADSLPARTSAAHLSGLIAEAPGAFLYDVGPAGWPDAVSWRGLSPLSTSAWIEGRPYDDSFSGRARLDLLPPALVTAPAVGLGRGGGAVGVDVDWREYEAREPITELRFRRDNDGLQGIGIFHSQQRQVDWFGAPSVLQVTIGYGGRTANGEYAPSTALDKYRGVWGRVRLRWAEWAVEVSDFATRHRAAASGGIVPPQDFFPNLYNRQFATSRYPDAQRQTYRNDLTVRGRGPLLPGLAPTTASLTWTSDTFDFRTDYARASDAVDDDTTWVVKANALTARLAQPLTVGRNHLRFNVQGTVQERARGNTLRSGARRWAVHATARDSIRLGGIDGTFGGGGHWTETQAYASAEGRLASDVVSADRFGVRLHGSAELSGRRLAWMETEGFEAYVTPVDDATPGPTVRVEAGVQVRAGPFDVRLLGFASEARNPVDWYAATSPAGTVARSDTAAVRVAETPFRRAGVTGLLAWRRDARRGIYAVAEGTAQQFLNDAASLLHARVARTVPGVHVRGRLGARFLFFEDLVFDAYVQGRGWTETHSRLLHTPTGQLVVPPLAAPDPSLATRGPGVPPDIGPDGVVDVHVDITLYGAKLFLAYRNALGGTQADIGTLLVPTYPLPDQQFRFGVHWPIFE